MSEKKNGGTAFPVTWKEFQVPENMEPGKYYPMQESTATSMGMSLRDYFAAKALIGLMAEPVVGNSPATAFFITKGENLVDTYAISAYKLADAMLAARGAA